MRQAAEMLPVFVTFSRLWAELLIKSLSTFRKVLLSITEESSIMIKDNSRPGARYKGKRNPVPEAVLVEIKIREEFVNVKFL